MRKENGITMTSLVIYVIVMMIVLGVMSSIISTFYENTDTFQGNVAEVLSFNKFNIYFLKEIKKNNNKVNRCSNNEILFTSGNSFSVSNNTIYYNNIKICSGVRGMEIKLGKNGDGIDNSIINVTLEFENINKSINYKLENIY